ncbi:MAG: AAA-like domain-containing protein [bacterium]
MIASGPLGNGFFQSGGALRPDSPSYIERPADRELYEWITAGDVCYVLTPRQMGKSSLMARTAASLRGAGIRSATIDLTRIGGDRKAVSAGQWYYSFLNALRRELDLRLDLKTWWSERDLATSLQRLTEFFEDVVLVEIQVPVVVFIDEIDTTIGLSFSDDFFAAIRACFNERATKPAFRRLSFVLLGVASPADLIKDARRTPFNVGRRIQLADFSEAEAAHLIAGFSIEHERAKTLLWRILHWTDGHPFLTQKLCAVVQGCAARGEPVDIDNLVASEFFAKGKRQTDDNLRLVHERITRDPTYRAAMLRRYRSIRTGHAVKDEAQSPVVSALKLSGLMKSTAGGRLAIRNRIYERVFDERWLRESTTVHPYHWVSGALVGTMLVAFFGYLWPNTYIIAINAAMDDVPYPAYQALKRFPWYVTRADEIMARYWDRRGLRAEFRGRRDESILYRLRAASQQDSPTRRAAANELVRSDYRRLRATVRHLGGVSRVAFSPDGKILVTGSDDGTARLWNAKTGRPVTKPRLHDGRLWAVAFSPDSEILVTGSEDHTARLWDGKTGSPIAGPLSHDGTVWTVAFSPDGATVLTGSDDNTARLWDSQTGKPVGEPLRHQGAVWAVAFSPDGTMVLTGSVDNTARLWNAKSGKPLLEPLQHRGTVWAVAFSPDGETVLTGSEDKTARLWNAKTGQLPTQPLQHQDTVRAVAFSRDGETVLTGSEDKTARLWNAKTGHLLTQPLQHQDTVWAVAFSPDGKIVLTGSEDETACLWDGKTGKPLASPLRHEGNVRAVAFSPDGKLALTASRDATARLWGTETAAPTGEHLGHGAAIRAAAFSPDGKSLLTASEDGAARLWDTKTRKILAGPLQHTGPVSAVAFSHNGRTVLTGSYDETARLWDADTGRPLTEPLQHVTPVHTVSFSPDGETFLTGSWDNTVRIWDIRTGQVRPESMRHEGSVSAVAYSPRGDMIVAGGAGKTVRLWDAKTGKSLTEPLRHDNPVRSIAMSPDGATVLTEGGDNTIRLWDTRSGKPVSEPLQHEGPFWAVAFSPDGRAVLTARSRWVLLWQLSNTNKLTPIAARLLDGNWTGGYRFNDLAGMTTMLAVLDTADTIRIDAVRFDRPDAPALEGDPNTLVEEWQQRLALRLQADGSVVPAYAME